MTHLRRYLGRMPKKIKITALSMAIVILGSGVAYAVQHNLSSVNDIQSEEKSTKQPVPSNQKDVQAQPVVADTAQEPTVSDVPANTSTTTPPQSTLRTTKPAPTTPSTTSPSPAERPFAVVSLSLDQPAVYCGGSGDYYNVQIGDVWVGLQGMSGGQISFGFEVTGDIPDTWHGYHQTATVPPGVVMTTFNKLYWGNTSDPHMAFTSTAAPMNGPAAVRAVVYTPNTVYSPWVNIPMLSAGEKCK